jgi:hypothetical protein
MEEERFRHKAQQVEQKGLCVEHLEENLFVGLLSTRVRL